MLPPWFGEFMGTLVLILLGDGVVAGVLLKKSKAHDSGWMVITTGWAFIPVFGPLAGGALAGLLVRLMAL
jgi:glycerol uptake facilitator protein